MVAVTTHRGVHTIEVTRAGCFKIKKNGEILAFEGSSIELRDGVLILRGPASVPVVQSGTWRNTSYTGVVMHGGINTGAIAVGPGAVASVTMEPRNKPDKKRDMVASKRVLDPDGHLISEIYVSEKSQLRLANVHIDTRDLMVEVNDNSTLLINGTRLVKINHLTVIARDQAIVKGGNSIAVSSFARVVSAGRSHVKRIRVLGRGKTRVTKNSTIELDYENPLGVNQLSPSAPQPPGEGMR